MIVHINFSLFSSPTKAYGRVYGDFQIDCFVQKGDEVRILREEEGDWFSGTLKIESVSCMQNDGKLLRSLQEVAPQTNDGELLIGLEGIVARTLEDAVRLGSKFEKEAGLFCDPYEEMSLELLDTILQILDTESRNWEDEMLLHSAANLIAREYPLAIALDMFTRWANDDDRNHQRMAYFGLNVLNMMSQRSPDKCG